MLRSFVWKIPEDEFKEIVSNGVSWTDIVRACGYRNIGNRKTVQKRITQLNLDITHLYIPGTQGRVNKSHTDDDVFCENSTVGTNCLRQRIKKKLQWEHKCNVCGIEEWQGQYLNLDVDHINGTNNDNRVENLRYICPNCHSQTDTFRGKNIKFLTKLTTKNNTVIWTYEPKKKIVYPCIDCNNDVYGTSMRCKKCAHKYMQTEEYQQKNRKVSDRPSLNELEKLLKTMSFVSVGKKYGVADNTIRKWIRQEKNLCVRCVCPCDTFSIRCSNCKELEKITSKNDTPKSPKQKQQSYCIDCNKQIKTTSERCQECSVKYRHTNEAHLTSRKVTNRPSLEELEKLLETHNYTEIGKKYDVKDITIRRWFRQAKGLCVSCSKPCDTFNIKCINCKPKPKNNKD
jgi:hypothetical protein